MRQRLQLALMATTVIATSLSFATPPVQAQTDVPQSIGSIRTTTDRYGNTVFVNDGTPAPETRAIPAAPRRSLVYWSSKERRWKPVPGAHIRAARSAAAEVGSYFESGGSNPQSTANRRPYTQAEIDAAIEQAAARHNVDPNLVRAVIKVESNFNPNAVSRKGAMGLMQLMPQTARQLHVTNPFDPEQNVEAGVEHLKRLIESYGGNIKLSLAAYNAGATAVARSAGIPNYAETRRYVRRITQIYYSGSDSSLFNAPVHDPIRVERDSQGVLYFSNTD
jgi:soluble lytic murein transglycosylase-like protein